MPLDKDGRSAPLSAQGGLSWPSGDPPSHQNRAEQDQAQRPPHELLERPHFVRRRTESHFPVRSEEQFLDPIGVQKIVQGKVPEHDEH